MSMGSAILHQGVPAVIQAMWYHICITVLSRGWFCNEYCVMATACDVKEIHAVLNNCVTGSVSGSQLLITAPGHHMQ